MTKKKNWHKNQSAPAICGLETFQLGLAKLEKFQLELITSIYLLYLKSRALRDVSELTQKRPFLLKVRFYGLTVAIFKVNTYLERNSANCQRIRRGLDFSK